MSELGRRRYRVAVMIGALLSTGAYGASAPTLPTGEPLAVEATALVPLDAESSLSIVGIRGQISIETRAERELRVISRGLGPDGPELPVGIWAAGSKLIVAPPPNDKGQERRVHVEVPTTFAIRLDESDTDVTIISAGGAIDLHGTNLRVNLSGLTGSINADLSGGTLSVSESNEALLKLRGTAVSVVTLNGNLGVRASGGTVSLGKVLGATDVDVDECTLTLNGVVGTVRVKARKGEASMTANESAAEFELAGTPLHLADGKGDVSVTSDGQVDFLRMGGAMHVELNGGSLRGKGQHGPVDVRARNAELNVESLEAGLRIQGDGLKMTVKDVAGALSVDARSSDLVVDGAAGVVAKIDRGSLNLQRATGVVQATVSGGDAHIIDAAGSVTLDLDGGDAEVSWASVAGDKDSRLTNKDGSITAYFPTSGACRVEAKSQVGRVESDLPTVKVLDGAGEAQGPVNGGYRPVVHIDARGDVRLVSGSAPHEGS
jgi:hypothetical protein